jgi:signal transduction histidine kinase
MELTRTRDILATLWPALSADDSEFQRRKKIAVRSAQSAVIVMVVAALGGAIAADFPRLPAWQVGGLVWAGLAYIVWSIHGTHDAVRLLLWEGGESPPEQLLQSSRRGAVGYFTVHLGLAALLYYLGDQGRATPLVWLVLLPPVAHSAILLRWPGIACVSAMSMGILLFNVVRWHGWVRVPTAAVEFSFALLFTLVFTLLAVGSEKARSQVQRLAAELTDANRKLREYAVQAEELAVTRERNRLAREIHDCLGHYLTVINVQIEAARVMANHDSARAQDALDKAQKLTQEGLQEIRRSVATLRSSPLDNKTLPDALRQVAEESRAAGLAVAVRVLGEARDLSPPAKLTLYRAGQEGLTNVRKYAQVTEACLELDYSKSGSVRLSVSDKGLGAAEAAITAPGRFGLLGLRERVQLLGGRVHVQTSPGAGFILAVEVPA